MYEETFKITRIKLWIYVERENCSDKGTHVSELRKMMKKVNFLFKRKTTQLAFFSSQSRNDFENVHQAPKDSSEADSPKAVSRSEKNTQAHHRG